MKMLPINMTRSALEAVGNEPNEPRMRFIGCALEAARLAMELDAPHYEIESRFWTLMSMMSDNLKEWSREDRAGRPF